MLPYYVRFLFDGEAPRPMDDFEKYKRVQKDWEVCCPLFALPLAPRLLTALTHPLQEGNPFLSSLKGKTDWKDVTAAGEAPKLR